MFEIGFAVEVDPEFPADGGEPPQRIPPTLPRIGAVLRVTRPGRGAVGHRDRRAELVADADPDRDRLHLGLDAATWSTSSSSGCSSRCPA